MLLACYPEPNFLCRNPLLLVVYVKNYIFSMHRGIPPVNEDSDL